MIFNICQQMKIIKKTAGADRAMGVAQRREAELRRRLVFPWTSRTGTLRYLDGRTKARIWWTGWFCVTLRVKAASLNGGLQYEQARHYNRSRNENRRLSQKRERPLYGLRGGALCPNASKHAVLLALRQRRPSRASWLLNPEN